MNFPYELSRYFLILFIFLLFCFDFKQLLTQPLFVFFRLEIGKFNDWNSDKRQGTGPYLNLGLRLNLNHFNSIFVIISRNYDVCRAGLRVFLALYKCYKSHVNKMKIKNKFINFMSMMRHRQRSTCLFIFCSSSVWVVPSELILIREAGDSYNIFSLESCLVSLHIYQLVSSP